MTEQLLAAFALMLIIEGLLPFVSPDAWRKAFLSLLQLNNDHIRLFGLGSMLLGLFLLWMVR